jgi:hypothetical protein
MANCRTHTLARTAPQTFNAVMAAAVGLGFDLTQTDGGGGQLYLDRARRLGGIPQRLAASVTDSSLGPTSVHIWWDRPRRIPWPLPSEGRRAARLCRLTERLIAG